MTGHDTENEDLKKVNFNNFIDWNVISRKYE